MTREEIIEAVKANRHIARFYEEKYDAIIAQYGSGVRPSHVSTELAMAHHYCQQHLKIANDLEASIGKSNE